MKPTHTEGHSDPDRSRFSESTFLSSKTRPEQNARRIPCLPSSAKNTWYPRKFTEPWPALCSRKSLPRSFRCRRLSRQVTPDLSGKSRGQRDLAKLSNKHCMWSVSPDTGVSGGNLVVWITNNVRTITIRRWNNVVWMMVHRLRRWTNIEPALVLVYYVCCSMWACHTALNHQ